MPSPVYKYYSMNHFLLHTLLVIAGVSGARVQVSNINLEEESPPTSNMIKLGNSPPISNFGLLLTWDQYGTFGYFQPSLIMKFSQVKLGNSHTIFLTPNPWEIFTMFE